MKITGGHSAFLPIDAAHPYPLRAADESVPLKHISLLNLLRKVHQNSKNAAALNDSLAQKFFPDGSGSRGFSGGNADPDRCPVHPPHPQPHERERVTYWYYTMKTCALAYQYQCDALLDRSIASLQSMPYQQIFIVKGIMDRLLTELDAPWIKFLDRGVMWLNDGGTIEECLLSDVPWWKNVADLLESCYENPKGYWSLLERRMEKATAGPYDRCHQNDRCVERVAGISIWEVNKEYRYERKNEQLAEEKQPGYSSTTIDGQALHPV